MPPLRRVGFSLQARYKVTAMEQHGIKRFCSTGWLFRGAGASSPLDDQLAQHPGRIHKLNADIIEERRGITEVQPLDDPGHASRALEGPRSFGRTGLFRGELQTDERADLQQLLKLQTQSALAEVHATGADRSVRLQKIDREARPRFVPRELAPFDGCGVHGHGCAGCVDWTRA